MPTFHCLASPLVVLVLVFNLFSAERQNGRRKQQPSTVNQQATTGKVLYSLIVN